MADLKDDSSVEDLHTAIDTLSTSINSEQADKLIEHPAFDATHAVKMWDNTSNDFDHQPVRTSLLRTKKLPVEYHRAALAPDSKVDFSGRVHALAHPELPKEEVHNHFHDNDSSITLRNRTLALRGDTSFEDLLHVFGEDLGDVNADTIWRTMLEDKQTSAQEIDKILDWLTASDNDHFLEDNDFHQGMSAQESLTSKHIDRILAQPESAGYAEHYFENPNIDPLLLTQHANDPEATMHDRALVSSRLPRPTIDNLLRNSSEENKRNTFNRLVENHALTSDDLAFLQGEEISLHGDHPAMTDELFEAEWEKLKNIPGGRREKTNFLLSEKTPPSVLADAAKYGLSHVLDHENADLSVIEAGLTSDSERTRQKSKQHPLVAEQQLALGLKGGTEDVVDFARFGDDQWPTVALTDENYQIALDKLDVMWSESSRRADDRSIAAGLYSIARNKDVSPATTKRAIQILATELTDSDSDMDIGMGFTPIAKLAVQGNLDAAKIIEKNASVYVENADVEDLYHLPESTVSELIAVAQEKDKTEWASELALSGNSSAEDFLNAFVEASEIQAYTLQHPKQDNIFDARLDGLSEQEQERFFKAVMQATEERDSRNEGQDVSRNLFSSEIISDEQFRQALTRFGNTTNLSKLVKSERRKFEANLVKRPDALENLSFTTYGARYLARTGQSDTAPEIVNAFAMGVIGGDAIDTQPVLEELRRSDWEYNPHYFKAVENAVRKGMQGGLDFDANRASILLNPSYIEKVKSVMENLASEDPENYTALQNAMIHDWESKYTSSLTTVDAQNILANIPPGNEDLADSISSGLIKHGSTSLAKEIVDPTRPTQVIDYLYGHKSPTFDFESRMPEILDMMKTMPTEAQEGFFKVQAHKISEGYANTYEPHPIIFDQVSEKYASLGLHTDLANMVSNIDKVLERPEDDQENSEYWSAARAVDSIDDPAQSAQFYKAILRHYDSESIRNDAYNRLTPLNVSLSEMVDASSSLTINNDNKNRLKNRLALEGTIEDFSSLAGSVNFQSVSDLSWLYHEGFSKSEDYDLRRNFMHDVLRACGNSHSELKFRLFKDAQKLEMPVFQKDVGTSLLSDKSINLEQASEIFWSESFNPAYISRLPKELLNDVGSFHRLGDTTLKAMVRCNNTEDISPASAVKLAQAGSFETLTHADKAATTDLYVELMVNDNLQSNDRIQIAQSIIDKYHSSVMDPDTANLMAKQAIAQSSWAKHDHVIMPAYSELYTTNDIKDILSSEQSYNNFLEVMEEADSKVEDFYHSVVAKVISAAESDISLAQKAIYSVLAYDIDLSLSEDSSSRLIKLIDQAHSKQALDDDARHRIGGDVCHRLSFNDKSLDHFTRMFPTSWNRRIISSKSFKTEWLNKIDDATMSVILEDKSRASSHQRQLIDHLQNSRTSESFNAVLDHVQKHWKEHSLPSILEHDVAYIAESVPELLNSSTVDRLIDLAPSKVGNLLSKSGDQAFHDKVISHELNKTGQPTSRMASYGKFNNNNWQAMWNYHEDAISDLDEDERPGGAGLNDLLEYFIDNSNLTEDQFTEVLDQAEGQFGEEWFDDHIDELAGNPALPAYHVESFAESDNYSNEGSDFGVNRDNINPIFQNPKWGGHALRSLGTDPVWTCHYTGNVYNTVSSTEYSKTRDLFDQVLTQIPPEGIAWGQYKKIKGNLHTKPVIKKLFMSAPKQTLTPEILMKAKGEEGGDFHITYTSWDEETQTHMEDADKDHPHNMVMQLNLGPNIDKILSKDPKVKAFYQAIMDVAHSSSHPVTPQTVSWVRIDTADADNWIIEEFQSDFDRSLQGYVKQLIKNNPEGSTIGGTFFTPKEMMSAAKQINQATSGWFEASHKAVERMARNNNVSNLLMHGPDVRATMSNLSDSKRYPSWLEHMYRTHPQNDESWESVDYSDYPHNSDELIDSVRSKGRSTRCWRKKLT